jgi:hypothetical protein
MSVLNKRNALLGWAVWALTKQVAMRKARAAVPSASGGSKRKRAAAIAGLAILGLGAWALSKRSGEDETESLG